MVTTTDVGNAQGQGVLDHQVLHISGAQHFFGGRGGGGSGHGELAKPAHMKALETSLGIKDELSNATNVPQGDAVADITRSEDEPILIPGNAVGTATPKGIPVC